MATEDAILICFAVGSGFFSSQFHNPRFKSLWFKRGLHNQLLYERMILSRSPDLYFCQVFLQLCAHSLRSGRDSATPDFVRKFTLIPAIIHPIRLRPPLRKLQKRI
jgi:hypothetical protein